MHCALIDLPQLASPTGWAFCTPAATLAPKLLPVKPPPRGIDQVHHAVMAARGGVHARAFLREGRPPTSKPNSQGQLQVDACPIIGAQKGTSPLSVVVALSRLSPRRTINQLLRITPSLGHILLNPFDCFAFVSMLYTSPRHPQPTLFPTQHHIIP